MPFNGFHLKLWIQVQALLKVLESMLQRHLWVACETRHLMAPIDPVTPVGLMHCLTTVAHGSSATLAVVSLVAPVDVSQKILHWESSATAADVSLVTIVVQSHESCCQEPVLWQAWRLVFNTVDSPTPYRTHEVVLTKHHCSHEPSQAMLNGDVIF